MTEEQKEVKEALASKDGRCLLRMIRRKQCSTEKIVAGQPIVLLIFPCAAPGENAQTFMFCSHACLNQYILLEQEQDE